MAATLPASRPVMGSSFRFVRVRGLVRAGCVRVGPRAFCAVPGCVMGPSPTRPRRLRAPPWRIDPGRPRPPRAPSTGFEPARTAPEAAALSPELRGQTLQTNAAVTAPAPRRRSALLLAGGVGLRCGVVAWPRWCGRPFRRRGPAGSGAGRGGSDRSSCLLVGAALAAGARRGGNARAGTLTVVAGWCATYAGSTPVECWRPGEERRRPRCRRTPWDDRRRVLRRSRGFAA